MIQDVLEEWWTGRRRWNQGVSKEEQFICVPDNYSCRIDHPELAASAQELSVLSPQCCRLAGLAELLFSWMEPPIGLTLQGGKDIMPLPVARNCDVNQNKGGTGYCEASEGQSWAPSTFEINCYSKPEIQEDPSHFQMAPAQDPTYRK